LPCVIETVIIDRACSSLGDAGVDIYWTLKSIPELSQLSSTERGVTWRQAYPRTLRHWQTWIGLAACCACAYLGCRLGFILGHPVPGAAIGGAAGGFIFSQACIHVARMHYKNILLKSSR
jgi:hypothetical protein